MSIPARRVVSGLAWVVLSPIAVLMALISKHGSDREYVVMVMLLGSWSAAGLVSGVGTIAGAAWATPVQTVLKWLAFGFYAVAGVAIAIYSVALSLPPQSRMFGLKMAAAVFATGLPFLLFALKGRFAKSK